MQYHGKFHDPPRRPADRRPGDRPYFIEDQCSVCGGPLVYSHPWDMTMDEDAAGKIIHRELTERDPVWFDSFVCPVHASRDDFRYLDWPKSELDYLEESAKERAYSHEKWGYLRRVGMVDDDFNWVGRPHGKRGRRR